jgi:hypothetical protein
MFQKLDFKVNFKNCDKSMVELYYIFFFFMDCLRFK